MSNPNEKYLQIIGAIANHAQGEKARSTARQITDIAFDFRSHSIFAEALKDSSFDKSQAKKELLRLIGDFRLQVKELTGHDAPESDDDLYAGIIHPLINLLIDRSA